MSLEPDVKKPLIFQTLIIWFNIIHNLKYLRSVTFRSKDIVIKNSEFVAKTQFLYKKNNIIEKSIKKLEKLKTNKDDLLTSSLLTSCLLS